MSKSKDEDVFDAAYFIYRLHARADADKHELSKALIALGSYAQKNCSEATWNIRLEAVMLSSPTSVPMER